MLLLAIFFYVAMASKVKRLNACRACKSLAAEVDRRVESTSKITDQIQVGKRFGPNGEVIPKKLIPYTESENRFMDIFDIGICDNNPFKSECFEIYNDHESTFHYWFFKEGRSHFLEKFCFKHIPGCSAEALMEAEIAEKAEAKSSEGSGKKSADQNQKNEELLAQIEKVAAAGSKKDEQKNTNRNAGNKKAEKDKVKKKKFTQQHASYILYSLIAIILILMLGVMWATHKPAYQLVDNKTDDNKSGNTSEPVKGVTRRRKSAAREL